MIAPALRKEVVRSGWLPAAVLVLGLGVVLGIVSSSADVSPASLRKYWPDEGRIYPVGYFPIGWWSYLGRELYYPAIGGNVHAATAAFSIVYLGAATALGSFFVDGLRAEDRWPRSVSVLAGFLPGYLMLLVPLQLLFARVPFQTATWIALLGLPALVVVLHRRALIDVARALRSDRTARRRAVTAAVIVIGLVAVAAVHRLQAGRFFLIQDSLLWWLIGATDQLRGAGGGHLLQWNQQTDEWVFSAPMLLRSYTDRDALFSLYATQSVGLVSFACLVFGIVHRLAQRRRMLAAAVATGVVLASTPLIYPWQYITIIGGDNPMLWTGQAGRQIGIVAPWAALLLMGGRHRRATTISIGLATAGLTFTSLQNMVYVLAAVCVGLAWRSVGGRASTWIERRRVLGLAHLFPVVVLAGIVYAFWWLHRAWVPTDTVWWLVMSTVVAVVGAVAIGLATRERTAIGARRGRLAWSGAWVAALMGGLLLSNNSTNDLGGGVRRLLSPVLPGYGEPLMARTDLGGDVFGNLQFPSYTGVGCEYFNYCVSFVGFLSSFGFLLVVALATWFAFGRMTTDVAVNARRVAWLLLVATMSMAIMVMFFTGAEVPHKPLLFNRLLDVPYYGLLGLAALTFAGARDRATAIVGTGVLVIWTVVPLIGSRWPEQMIANGEWVLHHAGLS